MSHFQSLLGNGSKRLTRLLLYHWHELPQASFLSFVATKVCLSRQNISRQTYFLSRQKTCFVATKHGLVAIDTSFVATKMILVATPANDTPQTQFLFETEETLDFSADTILFSGQFHLTEFLESLTQSSSQHRPGDRRGEDPAIAPNT